MPWTVTPEMDAALRSPIIRPAILFSLDHPLGFVRLWSGIGNITWGGNVYRGAGVLLNVSPSEDTTELQITRLTFTVVAPDFDDQMLSMITTPIRRRALLSWKALLDENANVIPNPRLRFSGVADAPSISDDEQGKRIITMAAEGALHNLVSPLHKQVSNEEQLARFPGDTGLSLMSVIPTQQLVWNTGAYNGFVPP